MRQGADWVGGWEAKAGPCQGSGRRFCVGGTKGLLRAENASVRGFVEGSVL